MKNLLDPVEEAIEAIRHGKVVIVVDDEDRENEGDFVTAARNATPEVINFMATYGRGLICAALTEARCAELGLDPMVADNTALHATPFTVSVDLRGHGTSTGISASDRSKTVLSLIDPTTRPEDLGRPGHIFPLKARQGGVLRRTGHTEATVDLARLAGMEPAGVLVEILNEDGSMARLPQLRQIADRFGLKLVSIEQLVAYRMRTDRSIERKVRVKLPTAYGDFDLIAYEQTDTGEEHLALVKGEWKTDEAVLVRVHSSCLTGDIFGSCRCDCGPQLHKAMQVIQASGQGVLLYMQQEGRGIGLMNKLRAYELQEKGLDTVEANLKLGYDADVRDYGVGAQILHDLDVHKLRLLTNNPKKRAGLIGYGLQVVEHVPIEVAANHHNASYLRTKKEKLGHTLRLDSTD
jgi:3,4-dihydroxy 2-butanone 4-phosphate synthase / GTP cyclohydrolase II